MIRVNSRFLLARFFKNLIRNLSVEASFVIFTGSSLSEQIIITLRFQNGLSDLHCLTHLLHFFFL